MKVLYDLSCPDQLIINFSKLELDNIRFNTSVEDPNASYNIDQGGIVIPSRYKGYFLYKLYEGEIDPYEIVYYMAQNTGEIYSDVWDHLSMFDKEEIIENLYKNNQNFKIVYAFNINPEVFLQIQKTSILIRWNSQINPLITIDNRLVITGLDKYNQPLTIDLDLYSPLFDKDTREYLIALKE